MLSLVERDGRVRSFHVPDVTAQTLKPIIVSHVNKATYLMTDESPVYTAIGRDFSGHGTVNHSAEEYVRAAFWHTNTVENFFSIFKRGIYGCYFHVSEAHLHRYAAEFDFRYNNRVALGVDDLARADRALVGAKGKRLTYETTRLTRRPVPPPFSASGVALGHRPLIRASCRSPSRTGTSNDARPRRRYPAVAAGRQGANTMADIIAPAWEQTRTV